MAIIDSILRNYYIPPVIFHVSYDSTGEEKRVAIGEPGPHPLEGKLLKRA
jgi:hypothetical protein